MKAMIKEYDVDINKIKGVKAIGKEKIVNIKYSRIYRHVVVLNDTEYLINDLGYPEMTEEAQGEYDKFLSGIRNAVNRDRITVVEEGYGDGEDELEWHITALVNDLENSDKVSAVIEFDVCVRTEA